MAILRASVEPMSQSVTAPSPDSPSSNSALLSVRNVSSASAPRPVLRGITLDIASGEFLTILGESGSGKTTLLRLIAGFENLDGGEIWMDGARLDTITAHKRQVNTVFQSYAIFPHLSVTENVAYGLRAKKTPKQEIPGSRFASTRDGQNVGVRAASARAIERRPATTGGAGTSLGKSSASPAARRAAFCLGCQSRVVKCRSS